MNALVTALETTSVSSEQRCSLVRSIFTSAAVLVLLACVGIMALIKLLIKLPC